MRFAPVRLLTAGDMSGNLVSTGVNLNQCVLYSIQAVFTGAPVGILKLQISDDIVPISPSSTNPVSDNPSANVVNWSDYTGSEYSISAAGNITWKVADVSEVWVRVVYTRTSGTGALTIVYAGKGV